MEPTSLSDEPIYTSIQFPLIDNTSNGNPPENLQKANQYFATLNDFIMTDCKGIDKNHNILPPLNLAYSCFCSGVKFLRDLVIFNPCR